jgi:hypothetical protein
LTLYHIREMKSPMEHIKESRNEVHDKVYILISTLVFLTIIPTVIYASLKHGNSNEHIFMFLIMQIGIIITVLADLSRTNSDI